MTMKLALALRETVMLLPVCPETDADETGSSLRPTLIHFEGNPVHRGGARGEGSGNSGGA